MQYVHILALIDADLERLKKVRLLLTTLDTPPKGTQKRAPNPPVRSKTLRTAERQKPAAPALQIDEHEVSQRKKARPAMKLKKPAVSNLGAARLAKAPAPAASEWALVLDDQIRQEQPQGQRAQVVEGVTTPNVKNRTIRNWDHSFEAAKGRSGLNPPFRSRPAACQV